MCDIDRHTHKYTIYVVIIWLCKTTTKQRRAMYNGRTIYNIIQYKDMPFRVIVLK